MAANFALKVQTVTYTRLQDLLLNILLTMESDCVYVRKKEAKEKGHYIVSAALSSNM